MAWTNKTRTENEPAKNTFHDIDNYLCQFLVTNDRSDFGVSSSQQSLSGSKHARSSRCLHVMDDGHLDQWFWQTR